uniref:Uncharacterized protein n=2 Tax=Arion vulgaris TaxID=1028688 RepID=A0A0B7ASG1_9EUPU
MVKLLQYLASFGPEHLLSSSMCLVQLFQAHGSLHTSCRAIPVTLYGRSSHSTV